MKDTAGLEYGKNMLEVISKGGNFNRWMYETIRPLCRGEILEIGSGIGNVSAFFLEGGASVTLSDLEDEYFSFLTGRFSGYKNLKGIHQLDFADPCLEDHHPGLLNRYDTVFALNVLEHVPDHDMALLNCCKLLKPGGRAVILVPAFASLFNCFDVRLEHVRRYSINLLSGHFEKNGLRVVYKRYFNSPGILGWFFTGKILRRKNIPEGQMGIFDRLVPVWKIVDIPMSKIAGLSIIMVGEKQQEN